MHSFLSRANAVFAYTLTVLAAGSLGAFMTTFFSPFHHDVTVRVTKAAVKHLPDYSADRTNHDLGFVNFDIEADVSPLFNWNVKQLFLYLIAEYSSPTNTLNQVVVWDKIIMRGDNPVIDIKSMHPKYYFWDDGVGLKGHNNMSLYLSWNVVPNAGHLPLIPMANGVHKFTFPDEYTTGKIK